MSTYKNNTYSNDENVKSATIRKFGNIRKNAGYCFREKSKSCFELISEPSLDQSSDTNKIVLVNLNGESNYPFPFGDKNGDRMTLEIPLIESFLKNQFDFQIVLSIYYPTFRIYMKKHGALKKLFRNVYIK